MAAKILEKLFSSRSLILFIHFWLAVVTIIALDFSGDLYDLQESMWRADCVKKWRDAVSAKSGSAAADAQAKCPTYGKITVGLFGTTTTQHGFFHDTCGNVWEYKAPSAPAGIGGPPPPPPPPPEGTPGTAFTGFLWGLFVGLVGLCSLAVFALNIFMDLPEKILKWFYLAAACIIVFVAILGMSYNGNTVCFNKCNSYVAKKFKDRKTPAPDLMKMDYERCRRYGQGLPHPGLGGFLTPGTGNRLIPLLLSSFHATIYFVSFGMALMAKKPEVGPSPMGYPQPGGYPQPAGGYGPPQPREGSAMMPVNPGTEPEPRPSAVQSAQ